MAIPESALNSLRDSLVSSTIFTPQDEGYHDALRRWSDTGVKRAGIVITPTAVEDIATALNWSQTHNVDLAIKCGGHSVSGTSSSAGGLVIDLSRLNSATVNPSTKTITVGGGATWKDVDDALAAHGLAAVGGTVNHTGVGGLTLGGGYGWLSGEHGLTIDNLLSAKVVLADGSVVTASEEENADLFWALRGAGYNFGVVVEFTFQAYDQPDPVYAGIVAFTPDKVEAIVSELNTLLVERPDPRSGAVCIFARPPGAPVPMVNVLVFYNGTKEQGESRFNDLLALGPVANMIDTIPYNHLNALQNPMATYGDRKSFKGIFFTPPLSPSFAKMMLAEFTEKVQSDPDLGASALLLEFYDMAKTVSVPRTATAFASRGRTQNGIVMLRWTDSSKDLEHRAWARDVQGRWKAQLTEEVEGGVPQYINYAEPGDSVVSNIYGENLGRLKELKAKYDPANVFRKMHPINV
ncbi:FAD-binding oxidoreductase [Aspergillus lucknowensis]|uniref:FAD-binding PCMH-type domain-containing protein n=1 Tax=Aspergillus lucknowensis TaxID=176173 RepID=A0ABR4LIX1_9EURO